MTRVRVPPEAKFKRGDTVMRSHMSTMKFLPKGELEVVEPFWNLNLPLLGPGKNRWFYRCRPKVGGEIVEIQEKYLKEA